MEVPEEELPPAGEDEFYHFEAIGLRVETTEGLDVGKVTDVLDLPAGDTWVVRMSPVEGRRREALIPVVDDIVVEVDLRRGVAVIDAIPGLLPD